MHTRALTLITASVLTIVFVGIGYLHPFAAGAGQPRGSAASGYQLAAVDFVTPTTGWVAATLGSGTFAVLRTNDAGSTWSRQLTEALDQRTVYLRFFDSRHGVLGLIGPRPAVFRTADGGRTWSSRALSQTAYLLSISFVDADPAVRDLFLRLKAAGQRINHIQKNTAGSVYCCKRSAKRLKRRRSSSLRTACASALRVQGLSGVLLNLEPSIANAMNDPCGSEHSAVANVPPPLNTLVSSGSGVINATTTSASDSGSASSEVADLTLLPTSLNLNAQVATASASYSEIYSGQINGLLVLLLALMWLPTLFAFAHTTAPVYWTGADDATEFRDNIAAENGAQAGHQPGLPPNQACAASPRISGE